MLHFDLRRVLIKKAISQSEHLHSPREILRTPLHSLLEAVVSAPEELLSPPTVFLAGDIRNEHKEAVKNCGKEGIDPAQYPVGEPEEGCEDKGAEKDKGKAPSEAENQETYNREPPPT
jgi:hypothetical protein